MSAVPAGRTVGLLSLAWLIPGAGHFLLGLRVRGAAFLVLVLTSLGTGLWLEGPMPWTFGGSPLSMLTTLGCMGSGLAYLVPRLVLGMSGNVDSLGYDYGGAFIVTAGLMNLLLLLDVWDRCRSPSEEAE